MKIDNNKLLWIIISAGIFIRLILWAFQVSPAGDDGERYYREAYNMVYHHVFSTSASAPIVPSAHDMPLYPLLLAVILFLTETKAVTVAVAGFINIIFFTAALFLILSIIEKRPFESSEKGKVFTALIFLFLPETLPYSLFHMPESLAVVCVCASVYFFFRGVYEKTWNLGVSAFFFGLAVYSKPIALPILIAFACALLFVKKEVWWKRVFYVLLFLIIPAIMFVPWICRNNSCFGTPGLTTISGTNLYFCNYKWMINTFPAERRTEILLKDEQIEKSVAEMDLMSRSKILGKYARMKILENWHEYILFTLKKHPRLYLGTGNIALFRYLGLTNLCSALNDFTGVRQNGDRLAGKRDHFIAWGTQCIFIITLLAGYCIIAYGIFCGMKKMILKYKSHKQFICDESIALICVCGTLLLIAIVIGPVVATRYRFFMLPFFAMTGAFLFSRERIEK